MDISYYCRKSKANKQNLAPVELSIIINGQRQYITLDRKVSPDEFNKLIKSKKTNDLKDYLTTVTVTVNNIITQLLKDNKPLSKANIKEYFLNGGTSKCDCICDYFSKEVKSVAQRVGINCSIVTYKKYIIVANLFTSFVNATDRMDSITPSVINDFYIHLLSKYESTSAAGIMSKLKSLMKRAIEERLLNNPFLGVRIDKKEKEVEFLTDYELSKIKSKEMPCERLEKVKDLFLFQCFTGLAYADMANLTSEDIQEKDGQLFISKERVKTGVKFFTVLLPDAVRIIKKYGYSLPVLSNQKYNGYLKEVADICGIAKPMHSHIGRHTAACYLLNKGIKIEVVSKILGHSNVRQTQHYAKLVDTSVLDAIKGIA